MEKLTAVCLLALITLIHGATILVGPTRTLKDPHAAILAGFNSGDVMILDDATYKVTFGISGITGWTIQSASGNPYACILDGQGGTGNGHPLTNSKGILYTQSPGTIQGIGFINGGGADGFSDGEAGVYAESFPTMGTLNIINCAFDGNENGIFVPSYTGTGANVEIALQKCIFSKNSGNGVDGFSHNVYVCGWSLTSTGSTHMPSYMGNNIKSRAKTTTINDLYNRHDQGRAIDVSNGGQFSMSGGIYTAASSSSVSNFMAYASENTDAGLYDVTSDGVTIYCERNNDYIWNAHPESVTWHFTGPTQQYWASSGYALHISSGVTGLAATGTNYQGVPAPIYPF